MRVDVVSSLYNKVEGINDLLETRLFRTELFKLILQTHRALHSQSVHLNANRFSIAKENQIQMYFRFSFSSRPV